MPSSYQKILLDSSAWIELISNTERSKECEKYLNEAKEIIVPTLCFYEVYRKVRRQISEDKALLVVAMMSQNKIVDLTRDIALSAADLSINHPLAMADSFILAHALQENAKLITLDNDFSFSKDAIIIRS